MPPQAAQFIVDKIAEQAAREGIALSDVERNMLLFSETSATLPNIAEVNEAFDRGYDRLEYEKKVRSLIRHVRSAVLKDPHTKRTWEQAIGSLRGEDYYLLVMLNESGSIQRPSGDLVWLVGTALLVVGVIVGVAFFFAR